METATINTVFSLPIKQAGHVLHGAEPDGLNNIFESENTAEQEAEYG